MPQAISRPAPRLSGTLRVPGDKSISHRALMLGGLAIGETVIDGLLQGEDVLRTGHAMAALGASLRRQEGGQWRITGVGVGGLNEPDDILDLGNSGTGARLLLGLLASHPMFAVLTGDASLRRRPMERAMAPLRQMGARFQAREDGRLPLAVHGSGDLVPIEYRLPVASAQVKSAVLLAGLNTGGETTVIEPQPTRDHSEHLLRHFGAEVRVTSEGAGRRIAVTGWPELRARPVTVPGDPSSAAFATVAALLVPGSRVTLRDVGLNPLRDGLYRTLVEMGAAIDRVGERLVQGEPVADLVVEASALTGIEVPVERAPSMIDEYPILAVAAAAASGRTVMRGAAELRVKESDRIRQVAQGLAALGVKVEELPDGLVVHGCGGSLPAAPGTLIETAMDHRIAMSFLVFGMAARGAVTVDDVGFIDTSFPGFVAAMNQLGARIEVGEPE